MSARDFLDYLASQGLLDKTVLDDLRRQVKDSKSPVTAESIAKLLVNNGHLTKFQATKLVSQVAGADAGRRTGGPKQAGGAKNVGGSVNDDLSVVDEVDELVNLGGDDLNDLEPLDELPLTGGPTNQLAPLDELEELEELDPVEPVRSPRQPSPPSPSRSRDAAKRSRPAEPLDGVLEPLDGFTEGGVVEADAPHDDPSRAALAIKKKLRRPNVWNSPFLLLGGGLLILLSVGSLFLWLTLTRGTADDIFNAAMDDYRNEDYANSIKKLERFLRSYSNYPKGVNAEIYIAMARLRQTVTQASDPNRAMEKAREELPLIVDEKHLASDNGIRAVEEARGELSTVLPDIVDAFAQKAKAAQDIAEQRQWLAGGEGAMKELIENNSYFPGSSQRSQAARLNDIRETMGLVRRRITMEERLGEALQDIATATESGDTPRAYEYRTALLKEFREFEMDPRLVDAMRNVTQRQQDLVKTEPLELPVSTEASSASRFRIVLASVEGEGIVGGPNRVFPFLLNGAVYGVDAASGSVIWRHYVGRRTIAQPVPVTDQPNADLLIVDSQSQELLRIKAMTGELVWRLAVGGPFAQPVVGGNNIAVAMTKGRMFLVDAETGAVQQSALIPQTLRVGPAVGVRRPQIYQLADHDNLYVVSRDSMECKQVHYLGHKPGSITVPPLLVLGRLLVFENSGPKTCQLHVLSMNSNSGLDLQQGQNSLLLEGHVLTPPYVEGRRVFVPTSLGAIYVFDVDPRDPDEAVKKAVQERVASREQHLLSYLVSEGTRLWVGDDRLARYDVQTAQNRLNRLWAETPGNFFVAPFYRYTNKLLQARSPATAPGVTISAIDEDDTKRKPFWSAEVVVPLAQLMVSGGKILALSSRGAVYEINGEAVRAGFAKPIQPGGAPFYRYVARMPDGKAVLCSKDKDILVFDPSTGQRNALKLPYPGQVACPPEALDRGLLVALTSGEVVVIDLQSGAPSVLPFQPQVGAGEKVTWRKPAVIDAAQGTFLDRRRFTDAL